MVQPWNLGPPVMDFSALGNLGKTYQSAADSALKRDQDQQERLALSSLGQSGDYSAVGQKLIALGKVNEGAALIGLDQKVKEQARDAQWYKDNAGVLGVATPTPATSAVSSDTSGAGPRSSLVTNESGGRWDAQNDATGAGGLKGHFGRLQFGQARLQEAAAAGAIPPGTTPQQFMASPELQKSAEAWHFNDIDQSIKANGFDALVGKTINGVPITVDGMRAVAHLGGKGGLKRFIETNGAYNPPDANGTRLSDYFARHGGGSDTVPAPTAVASAPLPPITGASSPAQVATAGAPVQNIPGDDPVKLRADAAAYAQTNPEASRQLLARADALDGGRRAVPVQVAQAAPQPNEPLADSRPQGPNAAPTQGFAIPGTDQVIDASIASNPKVQTLSRALLGAPEKFKAGIQAQLNLVVEDLKAKRDEGKTPDAVREFVWARQNGMTTAKNPVEYAREKSKVSPAEEVDQRKQAAANAGVTPSDPRYQSYILTGKTPREDAQPLSATDKKAILEADEGVLSGETAIRALTEAKNLSKQAMSGPTAGMRAAVGNNLPDWMVPDVIASKSGSQATADLENTVTANALSQMKSIFGGNPTEGERKILLDIQGSIGQPDAVRQRIYDRAIIAANARLAFNRQRAADLRGGDYYKSPDKQGQGKAQQQQAQPSMGGARRAPDGNMYVPDPSRPGKYLMVQP